MFNKIFDIAPEVLIGVAVDLVVKKEDSFVASLGFASITEQVLFRRSHIYNMGTGVSV